MIETCWILDKTQFREKAVVITYDKSLYSCHWKTLPLARDLWILRSSQFEDFWISGIGSCYAKLDRTSQQSIVLNLPLNEDIVHHYYLLLFLLYYHRRVTSFLSFFPFVLHRCSKIILLLPFFFFVMHKENERLSEKFHLYKTRVAQQRLRKGPHFSSEGVSPRLYSLIFFSSLSHSFSQSRLQTDTSTAFLHFSSPYFAYVHRFDVQRVTQSVSRWKTRCESLS